MPSQGGRKEIIMKRIFLALVAVILGVALFGVTYTVRVGDTLEGIAAAQGVAVEQLAAVNSIDSPYIIWVGQILEIPQTPQTDRPTANSGGGGNLLLPNSLTGGSITPNSSNTMSLRAFCWSKSPSAGGGAGCFWSNSASGYYRWANAKWQPVVLSPKTSFGVWGEVGDDYCRVTDSNWSQTALSFKVGPVLDFYTPGYWFNSWSTKVYYSFRHAETRDGAWSKIQEDETWSANLWVGVHQGAKPWLSKTSASVEYTGLIEADAVGGSNGQYSSVSAYSPVKWECSVEQSLYKWGNGSLSINLGYRHIDGESNPGKDRGFFGGNLQFSWAKFVYELESGKIQQKVEVQVNF